MTHEPRGRIRVFRCAATAALCLACTVAATAEARPPAQQGATVAQWARAVPVRDLPQALAGLLDARRGSREAAAGRALIAQWAALRPSQRAAAEPALEAAISALPPREAVRVAFLLPLFDGQEARLTAAVQAWAQADTPACIAWVVARRPGPAREAATRAVAGLGDTMQAPDAAAWAVRELPEGVVRDAALASALARWSAENPAAAAEWVQVALEGAQRASALGQALASWGAHDPGTAREWLEGNEQAPEADAARAGLVQALAKTKPADALAVAGKVAAPEERQKLLQGPLKDWHAPVAGERRQAAAKQ